jgi:UDPglucose 6-dehydrogenase
VDIAVVGLGKLGAPLAAVLASSGHRVIGVDREARVVDAINAGLSPHDEPRLQEHITMAGDLLSATSDTAAAVGASTLTYVLVPTPSGADGEFSLDFVFPVIRAVGEAIAGQDGSHVVVVTSTVMPGHTDGPIREALEEAAGRRVGDRLGLCYNPEFIALGSVIDDMRSPDLTLIGESDVSAGDVVESVSRSFCLKESFVARMSLVDAEITKLAVNTFVTTKISYANMLAELCERLPNANADVVTKAIGHDSRIGGKYLQPATAYGGPCFPRDNLAFVAMAHRVGSRADLAEATHSLNTHQVDRLAGHVQRALAPGEGIVSILGLSYKPGTPVVEQAVGTLLADHLAGLGYKVVVYDPLAADMAKKALGDRVEFAESAATCIADADVVVIATAWPEFASLPAEALRRAGSSVRVIDCWRQVDTESLGVDVEILRPGQQKHSSGDLSDTTWEVPQNDESEPTVGGVSR